MSIRTSWNRIRRFSGFHGLVGGLKRKRHFEVLHDNLGTDVVPNKAGNQKMFLCHITFRIVYMRIHQGGTVRGFKNYLKEFD